MRGTGHRWPHLKIPLGITPACAGNRRLGSRYQLFNGDHPRVCGEQASGPHRAAIRLGSPPRVRGTEYSMYNMFCQYGITPACAGNSSSAASSTSPSQDHPRVCGEQVGAVAEMPRARGSPPRVRGTEDLRRQGGGHRGITPACAGNRWGSSAKSPHSWDHPRVCGEQFLAYPPKQRYKGSPPRVRGTAFPRLGGANCSGITPACAGNSGGLCVLCGRPGDHPRVCGEQVMVRKIAGVVGGSPPRVRGTVHAVCKQHLGRGITPACAGNSLISLPNQLATWDHPRVCGEQRFLGTLDRGIMGSPPRVRGTAGPWALTPAPP